ncbi:unnamed protein product, partial [Laminaria digitata]
SQSSAEGSSADSLVLRLVGLARTRIDRSSGTGNNSHDTTYTAKDEFLSFDVQLASFGGKAAPGSHSFPFSVMLPPGLPSSMKERGLNGDCSITYGFEARLHRPGMLKFDATAKSELKILSKPEEAAAAIPVLVGPETQRVKGCCCFKKGSMSIGFEADRSVVGINEAVGLTVVARNDSSSSVKSMHVEIVQVCTWYARSYKESKKTAVASIAVSGSQLGEVQRAADKGSRRGRSASAMEDAARMYVQELLAAGTGTRYELLVPNDCLFTLKSGMIEVSHLLSVRLKTPTCISSPDVCMPLHVQARTVLVVPPEAAPVGLQSVEAVPYAATAGGGSSEEVRPVVSVPQSAVTMEFSSELP